MDSPKLTTIGRAEIIELPEFGVKTVAKVDTGADLSSIWATDVREEDGQLKMVLFGPQHPGYTGKLITIPSGDFVKKRVSSSFGHIETRYVIKLQVRIKGRLIRGSFSLSDRQTKLYPILLGRKTIKGKFVVDVAQTEGDNLHKQERERRRQADIKLGNVDSWVSI